MHMNTLIKIVIKIAKMKYKYIFVFMFLSCLSTAQKVSNITFRQEQSTIIVSYDLETKTTCKISLFVSTDDGKTWQGPLKKVSGDAGNKIVSGNHSITWNVLEEFEELRGDKIKFQVKAEADNMETVIIGTQEWTVRNLDVSRYRNGDIIPEVKDPKEWSTLTTGAWCYYDNKLENGKIYGKLYNWYAVNDPRGLAPEGFHIPSYREWNILKNFLGKKNAGSKIKENSFTHWEPSKENATNITGFTALPGGNRNEKSTNIGLIGNWWSTTENVTGAYYCYLYYFDSKVNIDFFKKTEGYSVRCIRD